MKLSDFLTEVGKPVAYYPELARALGDMKEAVFICQMAYWKDKGNDPDGWIYKSVEDIENETALSYKEQTNVREGLKEKGFLEDRYDRMKHVMYFRVNWDELNAMWEEHVTKGHMPKSKIPDEHITEGQMASYQKEGGILPKVSSLNRNLTETTQKTTQKTRGAVILSEEELEQANAKVTAIIDNARKKSYAHRDKIPDPYLSYADVYNELTGQEPTKHSIQEWLMTFSHWADERLTPDHIRAAYRYATRPEGGFPVGRPSALTNTAIGMKTKMRANPTGPQSELDRALKLIGANHE